MPAWLMAVLLTLAAYRLTRLLVVDEFPPVKALRDRITDRHEDDALGYLVNCPFCVSVYASGIVVGVTWLVLELVEGPGLSLPVLTWVAVAGAVAMIYELLPDDE